MADPEGQKNNLSNNMSWIVVDVEADGPIPHKHSMVCFGAVVVEPNLTKTFYGKTKPISELWVPDALAVSGFSREEHEKFDDPTKVMQEFRDWTLANSKGHPIFVSDNPAFDWQWINYYFHTYLGTNPFGFSARRIGDIYCGMTGDARNRWKHLRETVHDHNPVNDAKGNAEALIKMQKMGLKVKFE